MNDIRIGVSIMHHPLRADRIPDLIAACLPLEPRVVPDPDPTGIPSPLRTAKRAWADIDDRATHHLVLQDDVLLTLNFAGHLSQAIAQRPTHAVSLYSHWDSPQNSYLIRRAVAAGSPWAPLSTAEWTPTQGLVLPVEQARDLAKYLAQIPDDVQDDDEMVVIFCRERGIPVVATVPHLVDHWDGPTIVGHPGTFHATVFASDLSLPPGYWSAAPLAEYALARRCAPDCAAGHTVELRDSRCALRFLRPGTAEPVEHQFGWYWYDWCPAIGVDPDPLLRACERYLEHHDPRLPSALANSLATEIWAAGYLLGADAAVPGGGPARPDLIRLAMASWIASGLSAADRTACDGHAMAALEELGVAAIEAGRGRRDCH